MSDGNYKNHKNIVMYLVNDPIVTYADTPSFSAGELPDADRSRIIGKRSNSRDNLVAVRLRNAR